MMPVRVVVDFDKRRVRRLFADYPRGMTEIPVGAGRRMKPEIELAVRTQFRLGGNPAWKANRPNTIAAKGHSKVLHGSRGRSGIEKATQVEFALGGPGSAAATLTVTTSAVGAMHQRGAKGPWVIKPRDAKALAFTVQGSKSAKRRGRRSKRQAELVFARHVKHPGYPARPFVVWTPGLSRRWEEIVADENLRLLRRHA
jgi:phage gpG-like protein